MTIAKQTRAFLQRLKTSDSQAWRRKNGTAFLLVAGIAASLGVALFFVMAGRGQEAQPTVQPETTAETEPQATVLIGGNDALGLFLVGGNGMTLYTYAKDERMKSNCYGECAVAWPPLSPEGEPVRGEGVANLGVIERDDGIRQVTASSGRPLYFSGFDRYPGDANGHRWKGLWFVVLP